MHAVFMLYGKKECVEMVIRDMAAQKLPLRFYKGDKEQKIFIECQVRFLPFGLYEFVFPKEYLGEVLTTLNFHNPIEYNLDREIKLLGMKLKPLNYLRKFLKLEEAPEFQTTKNLIWYNQHIKFIPIGIRYDGEITEKEGEFAGWTHEAI